MNILTETRTQPPAAPSSIAKPPVRASVPRRWGDGHYLGISACTVVVLLAAWALITNLFDIPTLILPTPQAIIEQIRSLLTEGYAGYPIWQHLLASVLRTLAGFFAGIILGIPIGLAMGYSRLFNAVLWPVFGFIRPIPPIAYIPLAILWFGIGEFSKVLLIFAASFNFTVLASAAGMRSVPEQLIRAGTNLGLTRRQMFTSVMLPAALPQIFTGLKTAIAVSWAVMVAAELIAAQIGLGFIIEDAGTFFRTPVVMIGVAIIGAVGLIFEYILVAIERRVLHWQGKG